MKLRTRKHLVVWLGLLAMWLIVCAPLVSQLVAAAQAGEPQATICSAAQPGSSADAHDMAPGHMNACGYCDLLAHHVPAPQIAAPQVLAQRVVVTQRAARAVPTFIPFAAFPSGRPRDPPVFA
jgi:hypothetical protein